MERSHLSTGDPVHRSAAGAISAKSVQLKDNRQRSVVQRKANHTGLPDDLKSGIEHLSGHSMDDVKVHYNSAQPAQLNAHAYAQGNQIHIAPGQEKHLPHEAWHVVQQKQGRVKPTKQLKGKTNINDDEGLEKEADVMGAKAVQMKGRDCTCDPPAQRHLNTRTRDMVPMIQMKPFVSKPVLNALAVYQDRHIVRVIQVSSTQQNKLTADQVMIQLPSGTQQKVPFRNLDDGKGGKTEAEAAAKVLLDEYKSPTDLPEYLKTEKAGKLTEAEGKDDTDHVKKIINKFYTRFIGSRGALDAYGKDSIAHKAERLEKLNTAILDSFTIEALPEYLTQERDRYLGYAEDFGDSDKTKVKKAINDFYQQFIANGRYYRLHGKNNDRSMVDRKNLLRQKIKKDTGLEKNVTDPQETPRSREDTELIESVNAILNKHKPALGHAVGNDRITVGFRGSLATGWKNHKKADAGGPVAFSTASQWDVDGFIVPPNGVFIDIKDNDEVRKIEAQIHTELSALPGYKKSEPFSFFVRGQAAQQRLEETGNPYPPGAMARRGRRKSELLREARYDDDGGRLEAPRPWTVYPETPVKL